MAKLARLVFGSRFMTLHRYLIRIICLALTTVGFVIATNPEFALAQNGIKVKPKPFPLLGSEHGIKKGGIVYATGKGVDDKDYELKLDVYIPNGDGPFPMVLAVHGGAWRAGAKWHLIRHAWKFVENGYGVVAINYRHAPNYKFPAQIHDVKAAVRWMRKHHKKYKIDPDRIVAYGYSAGGHLVSLLGTTDSNDGLEGPVAKEDRKISTRVRAVVAGGAPCEFSWLDLNSRTLHYWMGKTRAEDPKRWKRASPTTYITKDDPPFFFMHGADDSVVPKSSSQKMHSALLAAKVSSRHKVYKGYAHLSLFSNTDTVDEMVKFFNSVLEEKPSSAKSASARKNSGK